MGRKRLKPWRLIWFAKLHTAFTRWSPTVPTGLRLGHPKRHPKRLAVAVRFTYRRVLRALPLSVAVARAVAAAAVQVTAVLRRRRVPVVALDRKAKVFGFLLLKLQ